MSREGKSRYRTMVLILIVGVLVGYIGAQIMPLSRFMKKPLPRFAVIDFSSDPSEFPLDIKWYYNEGEIVYLTIQNIGDGDAHNVKIYAKVEVGNISYDFHNVGVPINIPSRGVWKVPIILSQTFPTAFWYSTTNEARKFPITPIRTPFPTGISVHLDVNITCAEEVTQKFTYVMTLNLL